MDILLAHDWPNWSLSFDCSEYGMDIKESYWVVITIRNRERADEHTD
jgi:hypothetical protein